MGASKPDYFYRRFRRGMWKSGLSMRHDRARFSAKAALMISPPERSRRGSAATASTAPTIESSEEGQRASPPASCDFGPSHPPHSSSNPRSRRAFSKRRRRHRRRPHRSSQRSTRRYPHHSYISLRSRPFEALGLEDYSAPASTASTSALRRPMLSMSFCLDGRS